MPATNNNITNQEHDANHELLCGVPQQHEHATWTSNSKCSFNGEVLSISGALGFDGGSGLFQDTIVAVERGSIYGLVGPNGSGKTSFVRALVDLSGFPSSSKFSVEYLSFDDSDSSNNMIDSSLTAREYCLARVDARVAVLESEIQRLEESLGVSDEESIESISNQLGELYDLQDDLTVTARAKADQMFEELRFGSYTNTPFERLSSGWRYKCQLISALLTKPDCLVIDEPSFLDTSSTAWFVSQIKELALSSRAMVVLISHKEALLDEVCNRILFLNPTSKTLTAYHCSYSEFQVAHNDRVSHAKRAKEHADKEDSQAKSSLDNLRKQLNKREHNLKATTSKNSDQRFIKGKNKEAKQKADHSAASKVRRMKKKVAEMDEQEKLLRATKIPPLVLEGADLANRALITMQDVSFQYEGSSDILFEWVNAQISSTDKIMLNAGNGQGKSTLMKLLVGRSLQPTEGEIRRNHSGVIAYFPQDALPTLVHRYGNASSVEFLRTKVPSLSLTDARNYLGRFGLKGTIATRPIKMLSAGQRVRLWLAREFFGGEEKPSLLILDEVTENLDRESTDSLVETLRAFHAAVLAISHDEYFIEGFPATQAWKLDNKRLFVEYK